MMNVLAIGLVLSSLVTAGFWSPTPDNNHHQNPEEGILKERHRVLVVEYEQETSNKNGGKTSHREVEVTTSPPHELEDKSYFSEAKEKLSSGAEDVKEKAREAASVLPNLGLGLSRAHPEEPRKGPGELICDAYGKCKHKIASALGKTKDTIAHTTEQVSEKAHDIKKGAKDTVQGVSHKAEEVKEGAKDTVRGVFNRAEEVKEGAKDTVRGVSDKAKEAVGGVYDKAGQMKEGVEDKISYASDEAYKMKEGAKEAVSEATEKVKETISHKLGCGDVGKAATRTAEDANSDAGTLLDMSDTLVGDVKKNVSLNPKAGGHLNRGLDAAEQAEEMAKSVKDEGERELKEILQRGRDVARDMVNYAVPAKSVARAVDGALGVVHLLGLSTAYGMCVWVTFIASYVMSRALSKQQFAVVQSKMYPIYFRAMGSSIAVALLGHLLSQRSRLFTDKGALFQGLNLLAPLLMVLFNAIYLEPRATKVLHSLIKKSLASESIMSVFQLSKSGVGSVEKVMFERMKIEKEEGRGQESSVIEPSRVTDTMFSPSSAEGERVIRQGTPVEQDPAKQRIITHNVMLKKLNVYSSLLNVLTLMSLTLHLVQLGRSIHLSY